MLTKMTGLLTRVLDDEVRLQVGPFEYQVLVPEAVRRIVQMRTGDEITFHVSEYLEGNSGGNRFVPRRINHAGQAGEHQFAFHVFVHIIDVQRVCRYRTISDAKSSQCLFGEIFVDRQYLLAALLGQRFRIFTGEFLCASGEQHVGSAFCEHNQAFRLLRIGVDGAHQLAL